MNLGVLSTPPSAGTYINRPIKVSPHGNIYKIPINHSTQDGQVKKFEVWTTTQAMQKHLSDSGMIAHNEMPKTFQMRKFAKQAYEKELRTKNGVLPHSGILVASNDVQLGNPKLWPATISHPEFKIDQREPA